MSPRLPSVGAKDVIRALERAGFVIVRSSGSHHLLVHPSDPRRRTTVAVHAGRDIPKGTLRSILRQAGLSVEEFSGLL